MIVVHEQIASRKVDSRSATAIATADVIAAARAADAGAPTLEEQPVMSGARGASRRGVHIHSVSTIVTHLDRPSTSGLHCALRSCRLASVAVFAFASCGGTHSRSAAAPDAGSHDARVPNMASGHAGSVAGHTGQQGGGGGSSAESAGGPSHAGASDVAGSNVAGGAGSSGAGKAGSNAVGGSGVAGAAGNAGASGPLDSDGGAETSGTSAADGGAPNDECASAATNVCTLDYPCQQTPSSGYTCRGLFPEWQHVDSRGPYTAAGGIVTDAKTGLRWQEAVDTNTYSWPAAKTHCADLALDGGGWRLPTKAELESIVNDSVLAPTIDVSSFPNTPEGPFWTSSPSVRLPGSGWLVLFSSAGSDDASGGPSTSVYVRCVR